MAPFLAGRGALRPASISPLCLPTSGSREKPWDIPAGVQIHGIQDGRRGRARSLARPLVGRGPRSGKAFRTKRSGPRTVAAGRRASATASGSTGHRRAGVVGPRPTDVRCTRGRGGGSRSSGPSGSPGPAPRRWKRWRASSAGRDRRRPAPPGMPRSARTVSIPGDSSRWSDPCRRWLEPLVRLRSTCSTASCSAEVDRRLGIGDKGQPLGAATAAGIRKNAGACIRRAVELGLLAADPWPPPRGRSQPQGHPLRPSDRRTPPAGPRRRWPGDRRDPEPPAGIAQYQMMTAVVYYAGLRPSEVVMLRRASLGLPTKAGDGSR